MGHSKNSLITGGPYLVEPNKMGQAMVMDHNCSPTPIMLERNKLIGYLENITDCDVKEINPTHIQEMAEVHSIERKAFDQREENIRCGSSVLEEIRKQYRDLVLEHHAVVSQHRFDLGRTTTLEHEIHLKDPSPVYIKQFQIPDAQ